MKMQTDTLDIPLLLRLIEENPEWRALFRRALLSDDILELPELFRRLSAHVEAIAESQWQINEVLRELAEAQRQTDESVKALAEAQRRSEEAQRRSEERLDRLEAAVQELAEAQRQTDESVKALAEAQRRSEERLDRLEAAVQELAEAQRQTDESVKALAEAQRRSEERLDRLEAAVQELAEAQRRTEQRVEELAEAQRRTEQRVEELAEAQRRTEQRVEELAEAQRRSEEAQRRTEQRVEELAEAQRRSEEAQRRTDERVDVLAQKVDHLSVEVNNLRRTIGATVEEEAEDWVMVLLEQKGYQILEEPRQVRMDGEVDVAIPAARDGQALWAVVEAKTRLSRREIEDWANRMRSEGFRQRLAQHGVPGPYLVYIYGLRVDAACDAAARRFGIGLVTGRGERVPPGPLLPPAQSEGEEN
jgi:chromosome segregation ATPase